MSHSDLSRVAKERFLHARVRIALETRTRSRRITLTNRSYTTFNSNDANHVLEAPHRGLSSPLHCSLSLSVMVRVGACAADAEGAVTVVAEAAGSLEAARAVTLRSSAAVALGVAGPLAAVDFARATVAGFAAVLVLALSLICKPRP